MSKIIRYLFSGCVGAGVNFLIYILLFKVFGVWYLWASIIAFGLSLFVGFQMQKRFTFRNFDKEGAKKQLLYYYILSSINLVINVAVLSFFVEIVSLDAVLAKALTLIIIAIWSFIVYQNFIFKNN